jgi:3-deoxy-D-manno-octulosonate 8-phosphate phosphatase (KDO 8-P phosphatase)
MYLEQNIKGLCEKFGIDFQDFLEDLNIENVHELTVFDLQSICEEYKIDMMSLLFVHSVKTNQLKSKIDQIKLLVLDVDGVMTDGGMYMTENGDQMKKFNTKDGMAIIHLTKSNFPVAIISSGFKGEAVTSRANTLGIQYCSVNREPKLDRLNKICSELSIDLSNVAMIGDDINDLEVLKLIGLSVCPMDAVPVIKKNVDIVLNLNGGKGCVREFIDNYMLSEPLK